MVTSLGRRKSVLLSKHYKLNHGRRRRRSPCELNLVCEARSLTPMAQSYFPIQSASPKESGFSGLSNSEKQLKVEDVQEAYVGQKLR
jgi:hypothetical protein